ncbi:tyrosine-type recombinase/integrase [Megasphaera sp. WILCCON 0056]|uniref:tyrosine-type recombinase/integrase n=1 Tax=Megasphaera sp. WILCCON 0056 TaxID=3345340 RepID=UPI003A813BD9
MYNINHNFTYRQKDKGWQVILSYKDGDKWRQKSKQGLKTKQQAKAVGDKLLSELQRTFVPSSNELAGITLREFVPIVIKDKKLAPSTKYAYERVPVFFSDIADKVVSQITTSDIICVIATKKNTMLDSTIRHRLAMLNAVFAHAINVYGIAVRNPVQAVPKAKRKKRPSIKAISRDDFKRLMESHSGKNHEMCKLCCQIAYYTGMRFGEMVGLTWDDISFDCQQITVKRQIRRYYHNGVNTYAIGPLKTANSYRTIPIPDVLIEALKQWKGKTVSESVLGFTGSNTQLINRWIKKTLPNTSIHDFRHTYATNLLANGVDIQTVAALCGDSVGTIISTYLDFTEEMRKKAAQNVDTIFTK